MTPKDPHATRWAIERLRESQARTEHQAYDLGVSGGEAIEGAGAVVIECQDNDLGKRTLFLSARPVLLGNVELIADVTTQGLDGKKPHRKLTNLIASPDALRDLARILLQAADKADRNRPRPKPVR